MDPEKKISQKGLTNPTGSDIMAMLRGGENHEIPEGASDHLPHEHVLHALLLGRKRHGA